MRKLVADLLMGHAIEQVLLHSLHPTLLILLQRKQEHPVQLAEYLRPWNQLRSHLGYQTQKLAVLDCLLHTSIQSPCECHACSRGQRLWAAMVVHL